MRKDAFLKEERAVSFSNRFDVAFFFFSFLSSLNLDLFFSLFFSLF